MLEASDRAMCRAMGWEREDRDYCSPEVEQSGEAAAVGTAHASFGGVVGIHSYWVDENAQGPEVREEVHGGMVVEAHLGRGGRYVGS